MFNLYDLRIMYKTVCYLQSDISRCFNSFCMLMFCLQRDVLKFGGSEGVPYPFKKGYGRG